MHMYFDREGVPISQDQFESKLREVGFSRVAFTRIVNARQPEQKFFVSTVWTGIDAGYGKGAPLIFETLVFPGEQMKRVFCQLDATESDSIATHNKVVEHYSSQFSYPLITNLEDE